MSDTSSQSKITKLLFHEKPFLLLKTLYYDHGNSYAASISKKVDCSYSYTVKLLNKMNKFGLVKIENTKHKKIVKLTDKGKQIFKLMLGIK